MTQAGGAVIDQQKRTEAGASGDDLGAPFSLPTLSKSALTHHPQAGGGTACGSRALSEGRLRQGVLPCRYIPADANGGLCIGRSRADHWGFGGGSHQQAKTAFRRSRQKAVLSICGNKYTACKVVYPSESGQDKCRVHIFFCPHNPRQVSMRLGFKEVRYSD